MGFGESLCYFFPGKTDLVCTSSGAVFKPNDELSCLKISNERDSQYFGHLKYLSHEFVCLPL